MKLIPDTYKGKGDQKQFTFTLIERRGEVATYKKVDDSGGCEYEVMVVQRHKVDREMRGVVVSRAGDEYLPSSASWGSKGWTFSKKGDAKNKMNGVIEMMKAREKKKVKECT